MPDESKPSTAIAKNAGSLLETLVETRFLFLLICFALYLDLWLIESGVDPRSLSLKESYSSLLSVSVFSYFLFLGSYSLLMVGFFPVLRNLIGLARVHFQSEVSMSKTTAESRKLSDWSLAFICLSLYNGVVGYFFTNGAYKGLTVYVLSFLSFDGVAESIFRLCVALFWMVCFAFAFRVDETTLD
ncbi:hypothetical protein [Marinobacter xestospongiae]|uniref:hypothetical protein n=1 Tax=Marinobacter xestospongiae TaxID=994319 RepID=UPI002002A5B6|nr:hypothetical protein [Marinobacter xestospongiae]MCK7569186.1 hypothetical protein [Marinobacter xestospongiae]